MRYTGGAQDGGARTEGCLSVRLLPKGTPSGPGSNGVKGVLLRTSELVDRIVDR